MSDRHERLRGGELRPAARERLLDRAAGAAGEVARAQHALARRLAVEALVREVLAGDHVRAVADRGLRQRGGGAQRAEAAGARAPG